MTHPILANVAIAPESTEFFGKLIVTSLRYSPITLVPIEEWLGVEFRSPAPFAASDFWSHTDPYVEIHAVDITNTPSTSRPGEYHVEMKLRFNEAYKINPLTKLSFAINGNMTKDPDHFTKSFVFTAH